MAGSFARKKGGGIALEMSGLRGSRAKGGLFEREGGKGDRSSTKWALFERERIDLCKNGNDFPYLH